MTTTSLNDKDNICVQGRNWGDLKLSSTHIAFTGDDKQWFSIPLTAIANVQQQSSNKNDFSLEFNVEDEGGNDFQLCEMSLHIIDKAESPHESSSEAENAEDAEEQEEKPKKKHKTTAELLKEEITKVANINTYTDSIAHIPEIQMITPRGKFDIYFMKSFFKIHGQTHNYKILQKSINRVFLLPKTDGHHHFLIVSLISPINQGNTSYHFLIFQIKDEQESKIELNNPEKLNIDLPNPLEGTVKDNIAQLFNAIFGVGIIIPSKNYSFSKGPFLKCIYKANEGVLYPLERCLLFVHKPVMCINHEDIRQVDCARLHDSNLQQRTFDMNIVTKKDEIQFVNLEKNELDLILAYFKAKKIKVNNIDEMNNIVDMGKPSSSSRRARAPITDAPQELPSDESSVDEDYYSESDDYEDDEEDEDEDVEMEDDKKEKKKHKSHKKKS